MMAQRRPASDSEEGIRSQLKAKFRHRPVTDREWQYFVKKEYVRDVQLGGSTIDRLAAEIREFRAASERTPQLARTVERPQVEHHAPIELREEAVAALLAEEMAADPDVQSFRTQILGGQLLEEGQVIAWLKQQEAEQSDPALWLTNSAVPAGRRTSGLVRAALEERFDDLPHDVRGNLLPLSISVTLDPLDVR